MQFIKKYAVWFLVAGLLVAVWYFYDKSQKEKATVNALVRPDSIVTDFGDGYDNSGIADGLIDSQA